MTRRKSSRLFNAMQGFALIALVFLVTACGGGNNSNPPPPPPYAISVQINPTTTALPEGGAQQFSAKVIGSTNWAVTWSVVEGAAGGAISTEGIYTAPSTAGDYHVVATSQADTSKSASATVTVTAPAAVANFKPTGRMAVARGGHTATPLLDGSVLVVGGCQQPGGDYCSPLPESELYDPASGAFTSTGSMAMGREDHTATQLPDGKVLVVGGWGDFNVNYNPAATAELYDPATRSFSATGSMRAGRVFHTATLLQNGKVLIVGGEAADGSYLATAELYDPGTGVFSPAGNMTTERTGHSATLLQNGKVLIAGGWSGSSALAVAELYDPANSTFTSTGALIVARSGHTATQLMNGQVLIAGGYPNGTAAELYDPQSGAFTKTGSLAYSRDGGHSATLLLDGRVLLAGGLPISSEGWGNAELFDPAGGTFLPAGSMGTRRAMHTATLLSDGQVLLVGGCIAATPDGCTQTLATAELYP